MGDYDGLGLPVHINTMLGVPGCGKSTYIAALNAEGQKGLGPFAFRTTDFNEEIRLDELWQEHVLGRARMKGTQAPIRHEFVALQSGVARILLQTWDHRGADGFTTAADPDDGVTQLRQRGKQSDSFSLCLDGDEVGCWLKDPRPPTVIDDQLGVRRMRSHLNRAKTDRNARGLSTPRVVVQILKRDRLSETSGMKAADAFLKFVEHADNLFPDLFDPDSDWLSMFTAVGIGSFDDEGLMDPASIKPVNVLAAPLFCLYGQLTSAIADRSAQVLSREKKAEEDTASIRRMSSGQLWEWWNRGRIDELRARISTNAAETLEIQQDIARDQTSLRRLTSFLDLNVVVHKGKLYRLEDLG